MCKLNKCDGQTFPDNDDTIEFVGFADAASVTLHCNGLAAGTAYPAKVPVRFKVMRTAPTLKSSLDTSASSEDAAKIPVGGINFEVAILSGSVTGNAEDDPNAENLGVLTSTTEWCTDSCGVGSFYIQPSCQVNSHDVVVQVRAGNVGSLYTISVQPE